jgi:2-amino-4-hydroxy-6-hydroxymethyldihydropteridine diphosphokinase
MTPWLAAYVGIGSNLSDPAAQVERTFADLAAMPGVQLVARSALYRTAPFGPVAQDDFVNAVAGVLTTLAPQQLLDALRHLEVARGRVSSVRWGPRILDLDLLVQGTLTVDTPDLTLPHPGIPERNFVLYPLRDIAPELQIPCMGQVAALAAKVDPSGITRL